MLHHTIYGCGWYWDSAVCRKVGFLAVSLDPPWFCPFRTSLVSHLCSMFTRRSGVAWQTPFLRFDIFSCCALPQVFGRRRSSSAWHEAPLIEFLGLAGSVAEQANLAVAPHMYPFEVDAEPREQMTESASGNAAPQQQKTSSAPACTSTAPAPEKASPEEAAPEGPSAQQEPAPTAAPSPQQDTHAPRSSGPIRNRPTRLSSQTGPYFRQREAPSAQAQAIWASATTDQARTQSQTQSCGPASPDAHPSSVPGSAAAIAVDAGEQGHFNPPSSEAESPSQA